MSLEHISPDSYDQLIPYFATNPKFTLFYNSLILDRKAALAKSGWRGSFHIFRLETTNALYFFGTRYINGLRPNAVCAYTGKFVEADFIKGFDEFMKHCHEPLQYIYGEFTTILKSISNHISSQHITVQLRMYYINEEQQKNYEKSKVDETLPKEFYMDDLDTEKELEMLHKSWHNGAFCTKHDLLGRLQCFPSCCIRKKDDSGPISWQLMGWFGQLNHTYTNPDYRRKGFATIVEQKVCQEAIQRLNIIPFKFVNSNDDVVNAWSKKAKHWTHLTNDKDETIFVGLLKFLDS